MYLPLQRPSVKRVTMACDSITGAVNVVENTIPTIVKVTAPVGDESSVIVISPPIGIHVGEILRQTFTISTVIGANPSTSLPEVIHDTLLGSEL
jgi:hypothetical protein